MPQLVKKLLIWTHDQLGASAEIYSAFTSTQRGVSTCLARLAVRGLAVVQLLVAPMVHVKIKDHRLVTMVLRCGAWLLLHHHGACGCMLSSLRGSGQPCVGMLTGVISYSCVSIPTVCSYNHSAEDMF